MSAEILVVDDDAALRGVVRYAMERAGFQVREASDGDAALAAIQTSMPDLMVLDVGLPRLDGLAVCRQVRGGVAPSLPIIFLTAREDEVDRILGLELGGDDYVTKPFSPRELASRVKAVLRRVLPPPPSNAPERAGVRMDPDARRVWAHGVAVELTATEFDMLHVLIQQPTRVYRRHELVTRVYGEGHHVADRTVDSHLRNLRKKLEQAGVAVLRTVHGIGYAFDL